MIKKVLLSFIALFSILIISGCVKEEIPKSYIFISYEGRQFIKEGEGVYKSEDDYVYYKVTNKDTEITMTFSDVVIFIKPPRHPEVIFPDGCSMYVTKIASFSGTVLPGHEHDFQSFAHLTYEQIDNTTAINNEIRRTNIMYLAFLVVAGIVLSFFVFNIDNIRKIKILYNSFIPMHEEPYEPTELNVIMSYVGVLLLYITVIFYIIKLLKILL